MRTKSTENVLRALHKVQNLHTTEKGKILNKQNIKPNK